ncbi:hypothetical protein A5875_004352, partial [Enterococcus sp. 3H8_DIV0648]
KKLCNYSPITSFKTVSYTHLDVYKRQLHKYFSEVQSTLPYIQIEIICHQDISLSCNQENPKKKCLLGSNPNLA